MVPGRRACGSAVLAAMATFAPSSAARSAIARPMPRDAPVMNNVLPARCFMATRTSYLLASATPSRSARRLQNQTSYGGTDHDHSEDVAGSCHDGRFAE